jgi:hypothetical protein
MRKLLIAAITAIVMVATGSSSAVGSDGDGGGVRLTRDDIPHCYTVGLVLGSEDQPCLDPVTCDLGDITCNWFCTNPWTTVECSFIDYRGVTTWSNILYGVIDKYREQVEHQDSEMARQAKVIDRLRSRNRHLRRAAWGRVHR